MCVFFSTLSNRSNKRQQISLKHWLMFFDFDFNLFPYFILFYFFLLFHFSYTFYLCVFMFCFCHEIKIACCRCYKISVHFYVCVCVCVSFSSLFDIQFTKIILPIHRCHHHIMHHSDHTIYTNTEKKNKKKT